MNASVTIVEGSRVTLHFSLALATGDLVDSNFAGKPATFIVGDGRLLPGFEEFATRNRPEKTTATRAAPPQLRCRALGGGDDSSGEARSDDMMF